MANHETRAGSSPSVSRFRPAASLPVLRQRAALLSVLRHFFDERSYLEVETPLLSRDIVVDAHLEPFVTHWSAAGTPTDSETRMRQGDSSVVELFLQTSPEFGMKRLLASGADAIYQVTRAFRNGEVGRLHNPEFTLVEWYRTGDTHHDQMDFTEALVAAVFAAAGTLKSDLGNLPRPFERLAYDEAFALHAGQPVLDAAPPELHDLARRHGVTPPPGLEADDRDGWLNLLLAEVIEPHLGVERPVFLYDYPASQGALAQRRPDDPRVAERFELYVNGIELANGYHELRDADELRARMIEQSALRRRDDRRALPLDNRLLEAMESGLPECSGVALGFDRVVMLALGASELPDVMAFPFDRA